jgi:alkanesulfonate monooxygenase SsuD/methylene tetrahydromethanopterin reductase-like flavin-dependent oxidoreductase (luciferase family)
VPGARWLANGGHQTLDPFVGLGFVAAATTRLRLLTHLSVATYRNPFLLAKAAATVDKLSGGRMVLGIGVSHKVTVENWFGSRIEHPVAEMREYVTVLRAIFEGREVPEGKRFPTRFRFMGLQPRPDLPIYVAGLSPNMLRLAGEVADGVMLWLCNPEYIRSVVVPAVREGRERAGKTLDGFDIVAAVPAAVTDDRPAAYETMRGDLVTYWSLPFYRAMIERSGFGDDIAAFDAAMGSGDVDKAKQGISERFLEALTAIGSAEEVRDGVGRYRDAGATSPCVGPVPQTDFAATLEAAAP